MKKKIEQKNKINIITSNSNKIKEKIKTSNNERDLEKEGKKKNENNYISPNHNKFIK